MVVEHVRSALVVRSAGAGATAAEFAATLPPEPSRTMVVVDASASRALHALDDDLVGRLMRGLYGRDGSAELAGRGRDIRLIAARTGGPGRSGGPPLAARLADRLGVGVVAPDGELIALRGGEIFSAGPGAGWIGFRRGGHAEWRGPRYPAPAWQAALPREFRPSRPSRSRPLSRLRARDRRPSLEPVTLTAIPAGLWARVAGSRPVPLVDLGFGIPVEPTRPVVLVGAPGERAPGVLEIATVFESLPMEVRETAVLVPYGKDPDACAAMGQVLADRLGIAVRAYHGLPYYATNGQREFATFDGSGVPERLVGDPESVYVPGRAPSVTSPPADVALSRSDTAIERSAAADPGPSWSTVDGSLTDHSIADLPAGDNVAEAFPAGGSAGAETLVGPPAHALPVRDVLVFSPLPNPDRRSRPKSTGGVVTVDAQGIVRPGRRSLTTPLDEAADGRPTGFIAATGPAAGSVPDFRTTASTVLPEPRQTARPVAHPAPAPQQAVLQAAAPFPAPAPHSAEPIEPSRGENPPAEPVPSARAMPEWPDALDTVPVVPSEEALPGAPVGAPRPIPVAPRPIPVAPAEAPDLPPPPRPETEPYAAPDRVPDTRPPAPRSDYDRQWLADRVSTPAERQAFRISLGWRYDAATRSVARLLAEHPGLRGAGEADEALMTDLAAVRVFTARDQAEFVESIRSGGRERDRALAVCAAGGLRRLPVLQGVVVRGGPAAPAAADAYRVGQDLTEAAPLIALDDIEAQVPGAVEILIWSATARRLSGFADDRHSAEVAFLPGTVFRALAVDPPSYETPGGRRVLLTEVPPGRSGPGHTEWAGRVLARLEEAAAARAALVPLADAPSEPGRFVALPGDPERALIDHEGRRNAP